MARPKVGLLPTVLDASDPFLSLWPGFATQARDEMILRLPSRRVLGQAEALIKIADSARAYDITALGFLRVDRVGYQAGTTMTWLNLYDPFQALACTSSPEQTGTPSFVTYDGRLLCGIPAATDIAAHLVVQGVALPDAMLIDSDTSGLPELCNEIISIGAAIRVCGYDVEREDLYIRRLPVLKAEWEQKIAYLRGSLLNNRSPRGGWKCAPSIGDSAAMGNYIGSTGVTTAVSAGVIGAFTMKETMPIGLIPATKTVTTTAGATSVTAILDTDYPVAAGWTIGGAVRAVSENQGEILDVATAADRMSITASLPVRDGVQIVFEGERVYFYYLSRNR